MKVSLLYAKNVSGEKEGYVFGIGFKGRKITGLYCADKEENEFFVPAENIKSVKRKILYSSCAAAEGEKLNLGKPVFDCEGNLLGCLTELEINGYEITEAVAGKNRLNADDIIIADAVIIKSSARILKSDVKKNGRTIIKKGTPLSPAVLKKAQEKGEYVQANLKALN